MSDPLLADLNRLPPELRQRLLRAQGLAEAKMHRLARQELETIPATHRGLAWRLALLEAAQAGLDWPTARDAAAELASAMPDEPAYRVAWAYAARRSSGLADAEAILVQAVKDFPGQAVLPYNLACYACVRGEPELALRRLMKALELEPACLRMALDDPDLEPLWPLLIEMEPDALN